jgi:hypothetical protein
VRYANEPAPANPNLFNSVGLPASPIRELALSATPDTDPPVPDPMTFQVLPYATGPYSIAMEAMAASDASGVEYYFSCISGGCTDSGWQDSVTYVDATLVPDTLYSYTVKARDKSPGQNQTGESAPASATTDLAPPPCAASALHVSSINLATVREAQGRKRGRATVAVQDDCDAPVASASIAATFTGDFNEGTLNVTDAGGLSVHETLATKKGSVSFTFCVDGITGGGLPYDPGANAETCESF